MWRRYLRERCKQRLWLGRDGETGYKGRYPLYLSILFRKEAQAVALTQQLAHQTYTQNISERQIVKALGRSNVSLNDEQQQAVRVS